MSHSYTNLLYHFVYSTKHRTPWLNETIGPLVHTKLAGIINELRGMSIIVNGVADHVHALVRLRPDHAVSTIIGHMKSRSTGWIHRNLVELPDFCWQTGFGVFTVSPTQSDGVYVYIANQVEHHRTQSFEDELKWLYQKAGIEFDPRCLD